MKRQFNPVQDVPETVDECEQALRFGKSDTAGANLIGIFQCDMLLGKTMLEAYKAALQEYLKGIAPEIAGE